MPRPPNVALGTPGLCVINAIFAVAESKIAQSPTSELIYAEGFALAQDNRIFDHAWVVALSGFAIDVTIPDESELVSYFGVPIKEPRKRNAQTPLTTLAVFGGEQPEGLTLVGRLRRELGLWG